jgi:cation diffusion facilitator CzcD-associated flavoprotein CzcO
MSIENSTTWSSTASTGSTPASPLSEAESSQTDTTNVTDGDNTRPSATFWEPPVKVIIVGAGIGGLAAAVLLSHKVNNLSYTVYDRNDRVGGTWAENTYPGVRCDIPSHVYQLSFAPNTDWSEYYSKGEEIQQYYARVTEQYGVKPNLRLSQEVLSARWCSEAYQWKLQLQDLATDTIFQDTADFFISAPGRVNQASLPDIEGLENFRGKVVHTSKWNHSIDLNNKRVAVIGNGASGQQILPNIIPQVAHIDHYVRSKTYVSPTLRHGLMEASAADPGAHTYTNEEKKNFRENPSEYLQYRKELDKKHLTSVNNQFAVLGSEDNRRLRESLLKTMLGRLHGDKAWLERLTPNYSPGCKRLTPAPGYLEAIIGPKVDFVDTAIIRATENGLVTQDGNTRNVDIIIAATGFKDGFWPRFPTYDRRGADLSKVWRPGGAIGFPETYLGIMAPDAPNYFFTLQAQGNAFGGSVPHQAEVSAVYMARVIRKVQRHGYRAVYPSQDAAREFSEIVDEYFDKSVTNDGCRTYFKLLDQPGKSRNVIGFPGTTRQRLEVLSDPRWEDFHFEGPGVAKRADDQTLEIRPTTNRFRSFWGGGRGKLDEANDLDRITSYLQEVGRVELRRLYEDIWY